MLVTYYCVQHRLALRSHSDHEVPEHEGLFFKAVCLRINAGSPADYEEALRFIRRAGNRKWPTRYEGYEDPRYLKEQAAVILAWHRRFPKDTRPRPSLEEAIDASNRALSYLEHDRWLASQILNNLCYYFLSIADGQARAMDYYLKLLESLNSVSDDFTKWAPNFIDTVAWARWKLEPRPDRMELLKMMEYAVTQPLPPASRKEIELHIRLLRS